MLRELPISGLRIVDRAEDLAQEALLTALERWPETGIPDNPGAWLMTTAKHRAIDEGRRRAMMDEKHVELEQSAAWSTTFDEEALDGAVADDVLRLVLVACHPVLSKDARVALTLRLIAGLSTTEIARAFLTTEVTMAQRIVRAKRTLSEAKVPFEVPTGDELRARVPSHATGGSTCCACRANGSKRCDSEIHFFEIDHSTSADVEACDETQKAEIRDPNADEHVFERGNE